MEAPPDPDQTPGAAYRPRIIDEELDELLPGLPAIAIAGPKAVGKTVTAARRAATVYRLDQESQRSIIEGDTSQVVEGEPPILIDEWQRVPPVFDRVRRAVDAGAAGGTFLLTGSATPTNLPVHSGAGRIVRMRMRPMTLAERGIVTPTVALSTLLEGERPPVEGRAEIDLKGYVEEILRLGIPRNPRSAHAVRATRSSMAMWITSSIGSSRNSAGESAVPTPSSDGWPRMPRRLPSDDQLREDQGCRDKR